MYRKFCSNSLKSYLMDLILLIWYYKIMIIDSNRAGPEVWVAQAH